MAKDSTDFSVFKLIKARAPVEQIVHDANTSFELALNYQNTRKMQCTTSVISVSVVLGKGAESLITEITSFWYRF